MQEEIENRTVNLAISTTRLSFRTLISAGRAYMNHRYRVNVAKKNGKEERPEGKQSIQELIGQNQGVSSIPIANTDIRDFEPIARKYGIDYAITKDKSVTPPKYLVFFKARDADAMTAAFDEYSNKKLRTQERPSVLKELAKLKALVAALPNKVREKIQERDGR